MTSAGNGTDHGDLTVSGYAGAAVSNDRNDRGVFMGRRDSSYAYNNVIDYITISTPGNAADFGDMRGGAGFGTGASNGVFDTGISFVGYGVGNLNTYSVEQITINTLGNSTSWGERYDDNTKHGSADGATRDIGMYAGGSSYLSHTAIMRISTPGSVVSFSQLNYQIENPMGASNSGLTATEQDASFGGVGVIPFGGDVGVIPGGQNAGTTVPSSAYTGVSTDTIQRMTITSSSDMTDHGDLINTTADSGIGSNSGLGRCDIAGGLEGYVTQTNKIKHK